MNQKTLSIFQDIDRFTNLDQRRRHKDPVSKKAAVLARQFHREVSHEGQSDVFPGTKGSVILEYYDPPKSVEVEIHPDGTYRVSREIGMGLDFDRDLYENGVSKQRAKEVIQND